MKISIFTPTHRPDHLRRLESSLERQTFKDFEWVIVPNGSIGADDISTSIPQARIVPCKSPNKNIGFLKKFACSNCLGEVLVEVDHDDELFPTALEEINIAFQEDIDFAYSNCCDVKPDGTPRTFVAPHGWESRPLDVKLGDHNLIEQVYFEPSPASFSKIWYAPNHFRAWRADFYREIGGHNEAMAVLDDHDLLCRTYISGRVKHIDKPLYIYHIHPGNTCYGEQNQNIQTGTLELHDKYIYQLVERWCDLNNLRKIDLCGGFSKPAGYESIDRYGGDITADLEGRWPFKDGEVGLFRAHDALEHMKNPMHTMKEIYRCLAPNGWLLSFTPSTDGRGAFQDPTHVAFWNSNSFWYYTKEAQAKYIGTPVKFQLNRIKNYFPSDWHQTHNILYVKADLLKFSGRTPGLIEI